MRRDGRVDWLGHVAHVACERCLRHAARNAGAGEDAGERAQDRAGQRARPQVRRSAFSRGAVRFRLLQTANWKLVTRASVPAASTAGSGVSEGRASYNLVWSSSFMRFRLGLWRDRTSVRKLRNSAVRPSGIISFSTLRSRRTAASYAELFLPSMMCSTSR